MEASVMRFPAVRKRNNLAIPEPLRCLGMTNSSQHIKWELDYESRSRGNM